MLFMNKIDEPSFTGMNTATEKVTQCILQLSKISKCHSTTAQIIYIEGNRQILRPLKLRLAWYVT